VLTTLIKAVPTPDAIGEIALTTRSAILLFLVGISSFRRTEVDFPRLTYQHFPTHLKDWKGFSFGLSVGVASKSRKRFNQNRQAFKSWKTPLEVIELMKRQVVNVFLYKAYRKKMTAHVPMHSSVFEAVEFYI
jgi:hypothetical protein